MSYQLILISVPESHHENTGALLVGNPCLEELKGHWVDLPGAQKEVESIALILNTIPPVSYTHLRAHETRSNLVCRLLLEKKK